MIFLFFSLIIGYFVFICVALSENTYLYCRANALRRGDSSNNNNYPSHFKVPPSSLGKMVRHDVKSRVKK